MSTPDELVVTGPRALRGSLRVPGDKGISHRALIAAALANGTSTITHLAPGDDVARTGDALRALGVECTITDEVATVTGHGISAFHAPTQTIDCGNSGTTMRVMAGLLAGRPFSSILTGDASLSSRPMARVIEPLRSLGARITARDGDHAPLEIEGNDLVGARIELSVASGQVKTALVLAGLQASGITEIVEPTVSRDHTERLFAALGAPLERVDDRTIRVGAGAPTAFADDVPGDPSSAAFFVVAATLARGSELVLHDVLLNPGRIAFLDVLRAMGAQIAVARRGERLGEPVGDIEVRAASLTATSFDCAEPFIDEVPALAVAAAFAQGTTEIRNAGELRVKESDRIVAIVHELAQLGIASEATTDGLRVHGGHPSAADLDGHGDHRIALAAAVAANAIDGESRIAGWDAVSISYPQFARDLDLLARSA